MSRKVAVFIILVSFLSIGFAAREPIVSTLFQWYLKEYCHKCLGGRLSYKHISREEGLWVLDQPVIATKKRLEEGGYRCQADHAKILVSFSWLKPSLELTIDVESPHVDIGKGAKEAKKVFHQPCQTFHLLNVYTYLNIPQGAIFIHDFTENGLGPVPIFFSINLSCKDKKEGCSSFWLSEQTKDNQDFFADFSEGDSEIFQLALRFQSKDFSSLQQVMKGMWPRLSPLQVSKGVLNGDVVISFPESAPCYAEGQLTVQDLALDHPEMHCQVNIPNLVLNLFPKKSDKGPSVQTIGYLEMASPATVLLLKDGRPLWTIDSLTGTLAFQTEEHAKFSLNGLVSSQKRRRKLNLEGSGQQTNFTVDMRLKGKSPADDMSFHFSTRQLDDHWSFGEVEFSGFGGDELAFFQHITEHRYPEWQHFHIDRGRVDAAALVYFKGLNPAEVKVERLASHDLEFSFCPWQLYGSVVSALGSMSFDLSSESLLKTVNADLKIDQGKLSLQGLDEAKWQFADIHTNLTIRQGVFQKSLLTGAMAGLQGEMELDGTSSGPHIALNFSGLAKDLAQALPDPFRKGLDKRFSNDKIKITATAEKFLGGLLFHGKLFAGEFGKEEEISFGFALKKEHLPSRSSMAERCAGSSLDALSTLAPALAVPMHSAYHRLIKHELGIESFAVKDGWFQAHHLPLNKYISPFLFADDQMSLGGHGDFRGSFDNRLFAIHYDASDVVLESSDFSIEIKHMGQGAAYTYDFAKQQGCCDFLVCNGTYFEKNSGLLFTEINAKLNIEHDKAHLEELTTFCNGIYFNGGIEIDWSKPGEDVFDVDIHVREMHGKVSQVQHFLTHIDKTMFFLNVPIDGNIDLKKDGGDLHFSFYSGGYDFKNSFHGSLTDGAIESSNLDLSLQELSLNFDYNHETNRFEFSEIQGTLLVGEPNHVEEYSLVSDKIVFTDYAHNESEFDLWISDKKRDIIRLSGETKFHLDNFDVPCICFEFDRTRTHFGDIHPTLFELVLKDWSQVKALRLDFDFQLKTVFADLQKFSRTGFFFLSRKLLKELNQVHAAKGKFTTSLDYDGGRSTLNYRVIGADVVMGSQEFKNVLLSGSKKGSLWSVDQLQLDEISLAFDVLKDGSYWNINFLGARFGELLLIGMEGQYREDDSHLDARLNLFEADLAHLSEWPSFQRTFGDEVLLGQMRATGELHADFDKNLPNGVNLDLEMKGSFSNGRVKGFILEDIQNMTLHYNSINGFVLSDVNTGIKSFDNQVRTGLHLQKACCDFITHEMVFDGLHFDIPCHHLDWVAQQLQMTFPDIVSQSVADTIRTIKPQGSVQGALHFSVSDPYCFLRLNLNDDVYHFMGMEHDVSHFVLECDPLAFKVCTEYRHQNHHLWLEAHSLLPELDGGEIVLADLYLEGNNFMSPPLVIDWKIHPQGGYYIEKMAGALCGMNFDLAVDPNKVLTNDVFHLTGMLEMNLRRAKALMDDTIAQRIASWDFGDGYTLSGEWSVSKDPAKSLFERVIFQGELLGSEFEFYGYRFHELYAQLAYTSNVVYLRNLMITDPCGIMQIKQIDYVDHSGTGEWLVAIPEITANQFRPCLLRPAVPAPAPAMGKSLVVREFFAKDVKGVLGSRESFTGYGQLTFVNPPKKNLQHTIFAIPAELLTRIGLDLAVLTPVRGTVLYEIGNGRADLKKFKDMYSKGRASKFYLSNHGYGSYVDFDGNLHLHVRMKQYNLIFKLAELFTVTVQGTLTKPTYTLQKHTQAPQEASK